MTNRLGGALSARAVKRYLELRRRYRESRAEVRRLQRSLASEKEDHRQQRNRLETQASDAQTLQQVQRERAEAAEAEIAMLQAEVEIFKARDELWAKWEIRERARLEAETARMAAAKARALDLPQFEPEN